MTPRGNTQWWPAQVQLLLNGVYDAHYRNAQQEAGRSAS